MNPEIKAKWVAALRSGEYKQGKDRLRNDADGFCCLGVLCDIYEREHAIGGWAKDQTGYWHYSGDYGIPPEDVVQWSGLPKRNPNVKIGGLLDVVSVHNDGSHVYGPRTFAEIADAIEAQL